MGYKIAWIFLSLVCSMKACLFFLRRFLLVFFLVWPGIHSHSSQRVDAQANAGEEGSCLCCICLMLSVSIGVAAIAAPWLFPTVSLNKLERCKENLKSLQTENEAQEKRMLECKESLRFLQAETEVRGTGILECKENLKSLQTENKVQKKRMLECKENLKSLREEAEARNISMLECEANLSSLQAEGESGYMYKKIFLSWSKWQWVGIELGSGALLLPVAYMSFNLVPFGYRITHSFLAVLFMVGVTNLIYGAGRVFIIFGDFIYETDLTKLWWENP